MHEECDEQMKKHSENDKIPSSTLPKNQQWKK
jgi:hypothetical protein